MANLQEVRTRIASVGSTQQITSAMKMVSAAKFRRAQNAITGMRPYASSMQEVIDCIDTADGVQTVYHKVRDVHCVVVVVITSNKGLCGAFNSNVIKLALQRIEYWHQQNTLVKIITIGRKASEQLAKVKGVELKMYDYILDNPSFDDVAALADSIMTTFAVGESDRVEVVYNQFKNSLSQILVCDQLLPVESGGNGRQDDKEVGIMQDYIFEPSKEDILREMTPLALRSTFYRMILDSLAAEHGARMTAMQKATDNATELLKDLRLSYNKARQASITNELIEIVSGSEALKG